MSSTKAAPAAADLSDDPMISHQIAAVLRSIRMCYRALQMEDEMQRKKQKKFNASARRRSSIRESISLQNFAAMKVAAEEVANECDDGWASGTAQLATIRDCL